MPQLTIERGGEEIFSSKRFIISPRDFMVYQTIHEGFVAKVPGKKSKPDQEFYLAAEMNKSDFKLNENRLAISGLALYWHEEHRGFSFGPESFGFRSDDPNQIPCLWVVKFQPSAGS